MGHSDHLKKESQNAEYNKEILSRKLREHSLALSVIFLIFELNQNRRMMERELVFMEAQASQMRADSALELDLTLAENRDLRVLIENAQKEGIETLNEIDRQTLFDLFHTRKIVAGNTYFQVDIGLVDREF